MKQKQRDKIIRLYKDFSEDDCWERAEKSAKHMLTAVAFKKSSSECFVKTKNVLLTPIGYYYSMFHMSLSLCWLHPEIEKEKLSKIRHTSLQNLIGCFFVNQKLINKSFLGLMGSLQSEREWLNYRFEEFDYDFFESTENNSKLIDAAFSESFALIDVFCHILENKFDIKARIQTYIADSKGDDLLQTYLSEEEQESVMQFIFDKGYSN